MARRNFYEIINESTLNLRAEYNRIYNLLYESDNYFQYAIIEIIDEYFDALPSHVRGRTLSLSDFNQTYGFNYQSYPFSICADDIINICEYAYNLCSGIKKYAYRDLGDDDICDIDKFLKIINSTVKVLCHMPVTKNQTTIFVPEKQEIIAVAEIVDGEIAVSIMEYHHHTLKGNLSKKKAILKIMADDIEPERNKLRGINRTLESNLFQMLQKFVRHNNEENPYIKGLSSDEIETCYDDIYQMWLLAKLEIDNLERKKRVEETLSQINA